MKENSSVLYDIFEIEGKCLCIVLYIYKFLKTGQDNSKTNTKYQSHHYNLGSGPSNLAKILVTDEAMITLVNKLNVKQWIKDNCERYDILINKRHCKKTLKFIEGLLRYKCSSRYDG